MITTKKWLQYLGMLSLIFCGLALFVNVHHASAQPSKDVFINNNWPDPNFPPSVIAPYPNHIYSGRCTSAQGVDYSAGQYSYIATDDGSHNFSQVSTEVFAGTTQVSLYVVIADTLCYRANADGSLGPFDVVNTWHRVTNVTADNGASVSGVANNSIISVGYPNIPFRNGSAVVAVHALPIVVTLPALGIGQYKFDVVLNNVARINLFHNGVYQCVDTPPPNTRNGANDNDFIGCKQATASLPFTINVIPPPLQVQAHTFKVDSSGHYLGEMANVTYTTCGLPNPTYGGAGAEGVANFNGVAEGQPFCLRISSAAPAGFSGPYIRPWNNGYYADGSNNADDSGPQCTRPVPPNQNDPPPGFTNPGGLFAGHCDNASYEYQEADAANGYQTEFNGTFYDRNHTGGGTDGGYDFVYVYNPAVLSCGSASASIAQPVVGQSFDLKLSFNNGAGAGDFNQPNSKLHITNKDGLSGNDVGPKPYQNSNGTSGSVIAGGETGEATFNGFSANSTRVYVVHYELTGTNLTDCQGSINVVAKPYFRVYGGDVLAGANMGSNCSAGPPDATIIGYNGQANGAADGAGTAVEFAAQALGKIKEFTSDTPIGRKFTSLKYLTFANDSTTGSYGGNFGSSPCIPDYYGNGPANYTGSTISNATIPAINNGDRPVYKVDGDISINGNITFKSYAWGSIKDIPAFTLIVKGNIYITKDVTSLDGVYIAQDNGTGNKGKIYTCTKSDNSLYTTLELLDNCSNQLTVHGSFMAREVKFIRTKGSLLPTTPHDENQNSGNIAEVFVYGPELWLTPRTSGTQNSQVDKITGLPPIL